MHYWEIVGLVAAGVLAADLVRAPVKKFLRRAYSWIAMRSPRLAEAIDRFLQFVSDSFGPSDGDS